MSGPFETGREVLKLPEVRAVYAAFDADPGMGKMAPHNRRLLGRALEAAGVDMGRYDDRIAEWLSQWEPQTVAVIAGWVTRANHAPGSIVLSRERVETALLALIDAKWSRIVTGCADCDAIETATRGERAGCEQHEPGLARAERYDEILRWLADAAGVPEVAEVEAVKPEVGE